MNITDIINDIKLTEGLNTVSLPYKDPIEVVLAHIIKTSIRTFSRYKPQIKDGYAMMNNLRSPDDASRNIGIYILPESLTSTPVSDAYAEYMSDSVRYTGEDVNINAFTVGSPFVGFGSYYPQDILSATMTGAAINKYAGVTSRPPSSKWLGFNKIQLFDFPKNACVRFIVKCQHDLSGESIPESCVESFMKLAVLDVRRTLYNTLKNINTSGTLNAEIQLKIDDWSGASAERDALLKEWNSNFHYDETDLVQFF